MLINVQQNNVRNIFFFLYMFLAFRKQNVYEFRELTSIYILMSICIEIIVLDELSPTSNYVQFANPQQPVLTSSSRCIRNVNRIIYNIARSTVSSLQQASACQFITCRFVPLFLYICRRTKMIVEARIQCYYSKSTQVHINTYKSIRISNL